MDNALIINPPTTSLTSPMGPVNVILRDTTGAYVAAGGSGGGAATVADGADVAEGAVADAVVAAGAAGTVSAKLRRLTTDIDAIKTSLSTIGINATAPALVNSAAYETNHVLKASAGTLISVVGYSSRTTDQFIQLHNATSLPADTAVPVATFIARAGSNFSYDVPITGIPFSTGIVVCNSSTGPTKTIGSADCYFTAVIK